MRCSGIFNRFESGQSLVILLKDDQANGFVLIFGSSGTFRYLCTAGLR